MVRVVHIGLKMRHWTDGPWQGILPSKEYASNEAESTSTQVQPQALLVESWSSPECRYLTEVELARRWHISVKTIQRWRSMGRKPMFAKFGKTVRYPLHGPDGILDMEQCAMLPTASGPDHG